MGSSWALSGSFLGLFWSLGAGCGPQRSDAGGLARAAGGLRMCPSELEEEDRRGARPLIHVLGAVVVREVVASMARSCGGGVIDKIQVCSVGAARLCRCRRRRRPWTSLPSLEASVRYASASSFPLRFGDVSDRKPRFG